ncbi:MAG: ribonuclease E activity regulator RraA [Trueperaceae bacterium]|nr:ribonuclease E activity regulator RraA [Trueperaceae bacterium]
MSLSDPSSTDPMPATADLCDDHADILQICRPLLHSFGGRRRFHGPVATVKVFEDNVLVVEALETIEPGSVLVVDGGGSTDCALVGDRLGGIAVSRGLAGIVVNGCVRDSAQLAEMDVGVLALATHPKRSDKRGQGERDVTVTFGGASFAPGTYLYADEDGVVVAPHKLH